MTSKKKKRKVQRLPQIDWNGFVVEWNALFHAGGSMKQAVQRFGARRDTLAQRCSTLAGHGIYLPRLIGQRRMKNKKWRAGAEKHGSTRVFPVILSQALSTKKTSPKMLADIGSAGMVVRLMPVAAG